MTPNTYKKEYFSIDFVVLMIRMTLRLRRVGGDSYENYIQRGKELLQSSFTC